MVDTNVLTSRNIAARLKTIFGRCPAIPLKGEFDCANAANWRWAVDEGRKLFSPLQLGAIHLEHRVVMAPLTRVRSQQPGDVPSEMMQEYYTQRASAGGLIISEATAIAIGGRAYYGAPGIYNDAQVAGWKPIVEAVHAKGGRIVMQLWHGGRQSHVELTEGATPVAPSAIEYDGKVLTDHGWVSPSPARALEIGEIAAVVQSYRRGAERAQRAGFDGVELHAANGYLPDQFLQDGTNHRTDAYGGPVENRARFLLEVVAALVSVWGGSRVGVRLGPNGRWGEMSDSNPTATFGYAAKQLNAFGLAYLHLIEPRINGSEATAEGLAPVAAAQLRKVFNGHIIAAGGFEPAEAEETLEKGDADAIAFGRHFIANPDLPERIRHGLPLNPYDRATFYTHNSHGYIDYSAYSMANHEAS